MKIKFVDDNLVGQNGLSRYIDPHSGWNREENNPDAIIYTDQKCFGDIDVSQNNYAWIIEPPIINGENYLYIIRDHKKFKKVFSYNKNISSQIDNFVFVPHGGTWLRNEDLGIHQKTATISCILSHKQWNPYHQMRHRIYNRFKHTGIVDFYGSGTDQQIEYKVDALKNYMFSIVVENSIENDYFTEKLLDCFLTGTIPIYCGTKNLNKYFDVEGVIFFNSDEDLPTILDNISLQLYTDKLKHITRNFQFAQTYIHPELIINEYLQ